MFKKLYSLGSATLVAFILVTSWMFSLRPVSAADIIVNPGESIQAAIDSASPGDTIIIQPGIYTEALTLNKPVSLTGTGRDEVILVAPVDTDLLMVTGATINQQIVIANLTFQGQSMNGCIDWVCKGIALHNSAHPTLQNLRLVSFGLAIEAEVSESLLLQQLLFENNYLSLDGFASPHIIDTQFIGDENLIIIMGATENITIENSLIEGNGDITFETTGSLFITQTIITNTFVYLKAHTTTIGNSTIANSQICKIEATQYLVISQTTMAHNLASNCEPKPYHLSESPSNIFAPIQAHNILLVQSTLVEQIVPTSTYSFLIHGFNNLTITASTISNTIGGLNAVSNLVINQSQLINDQLQKSWVTGNNLTITHSSLVNYESFDSLQDAFIINSQIIGGHIAVIGRDFTLVNSTLSGYIQPGSIYKGMEFSVFEVGGQANIINSHITHNQASYCFDAHVLNVLGKAQILDSTFAYNRVDCSTSNNSPELMNQQKPSSAKFDPAIGGYQPGCIIGGYYLNITQSEFLNNQAIEAIICGPTFPEIKGLGYLNLHQSRLLNNITPAVVAYFSSVTIANSLLAQNIPTNSVQPMILVYQGHLTLHHTTIANTNILENPVVMVEDSSVTVTNTIISNFDTGLIGDNSTLWEDYNLFNNSTNISWNTPITPGIHTLLNLDPNFANPTMNNFSLLPSSPAVDAGLDLGYLTDLEGNPRWVGIAPDMGALEYVVIPTIQFSQISYTTTETAGQLILLVTLNQAVSQTVMVDYLLTDGSTTAGQDYIPLTGTVTFLPGTITQTISLTLVNDDLPEPTEWLTLSLANPAGGILGSISQAVVYILDADTPPPVSHRVYLPVLLRP